MIKSTTQKSNEMFGKLREACKYGPLMIGSMPSETKLNTKRVNKHAVYCDQSFTINLQRNTASYKGYKVNLNGNVKFRLYRNNLYITTANGEYVIEDLDRYYVENPTISMQKTDPAIWKLCDDVMARII
jgi:hypothetical protein